MTKEKGVPPPAVVVELFQQADSGVRRVCATIGLLIAAAAEQGLEAEWGESLQLLQQELHRTQAAQRELKGVVLPPAPRHRA